MCSAGVTVMIIPMSLYRTDTTVDRTRRTSNTLLFRSPRSRKAIQKHVAVVYRRPYYMIGPGMVPMVTEQVLEHVCPLGVIM